MNVWHVSILHLTAVLVAFSPGLGLDKAVVAQQSPFDTEQGVEVLTRGPVHEAFAGTVTFDPQPGIVVSQGPPEPIEEMPPDLRPEGINVTWIPGYWGWDDDRSGYLWVSGIWRALPPGREWVPGYWGRFGQGIQWTSGYWADATISEIEYLPEPPPTVEVGPNIAAPSPDYGWVPGSWVWHQGRYAWRPGYWITVQPDWLWMPTHYVWTPRGYVFVDGYWDYSVGRRGVLFAPVYMDAAVYTRRGFIYSPRTVIDLRVFSDHLFLRPQYSHYYFGDYYAPSYRSGGFFASFSFNSSRHGYDPIYAHQRWEHRQDRDWEHRVQADYRHRRDHEDARPPRTLKVQITRGTSGMSSREKSVEIARPFTQLATRKDSALRFQPVVQEERQQIVRRGQEITKFRQERSRLESTAVDPSAQQTSRKFQPSKVRTTRSPIVAKPVEQLGKGQAPPKRHEAPRPDPKVEPRSRRTGGTARPSREETGVKKDEPVKKTKAVSKDHGKDDHKPKKK